MRFLLKISILICIIACNGQKENSKKTKEVINIEDNSNATITLPEISSNQNFSTELIISDVSIPWGITFLPDNSILYTEKKGEFIHFKNGKKYHVTGVPEVYNSGQGGLLDITPHPNFEKNNWIYFTYASTAGNSEGGNTAIARAKLLNNSLSNLEVLYKASPNTQKGQHFGSRLVFDGNNHIYFSAGERGERTVNPQDITRDNGKVYRLNEDGSIPADNPFVDQENAKKAIYSYGHRNPQGMILNTETNEIWIHEHGPKGGDEINNIKAGANYGWPVVTYGENYDGTPITSERSKPEFEDPLYYWLPSIAPSGFEYATSDKYPDLKGNLLVGSLKFQYLELLKLEKNKVVKREKLLEGIGRVRDVAQAPDGNIYIAVEGKGIFKLIKNNN
ncbi:PQQ-dependent sugar dehydrogenase [Zunongwangia sp.]|uniref:PQQ-dependent sugar dehydrogenase n=1 Tax=Zunongwangia sp. TaxID=1965325 RepID=UPI003AA8F4FA